MFKNLFSILNIILITVLIFFSIKLCYQVFAAKLLQVSSSDLATLADPGTYIKHTKKTSNRQNLKKISAYQSITNRDLFKTKKTVKPDKNASDIELEKLKQTTLNLKLFGTITGRNDHDYAVIEDTQKHKQGLYKKGDTIQNAEIKLVLRKKVVLSVNGKDEILLMEDDKKNHKKGRKAPSFSKHLGNAGLELEERFDLDETVSIDREKSNSS